ncbi:6040_t:CDS:2, partial [Racocetra persica]
TITLTIDNAKGALKADGFALEKAAGKSVPLTGSDLPKEVQIIFQNDKSIDARYKKLLQDLKKDLNIEIEITHAENIGWDDTLKRFTLNDVDFGNVKVERDKALDNKIKKWQVKIEKIITDYSTSTFGATQIEAKASKNHWGDADRGDIPNVNYFNNPDGEIDKIIDNSKGKKEIDVGLKGKNVEEEITDKAKEIQTEVGNPMAGADITMANFRKNKGSLSADLNFQTMVKGAKNIKFKSSATNKDAFASAKNERWLNYESYATSGDDEDAAKETTRLLMHRTEKNAEGTSNTNCRIAYDGDWCTGADIEYVARVLERPIGLVYRAAAVNGVLVPNTTEPDYIALARPEDHQEGKFEFTADDIEVDDGKQAIFFTFKKGSIKYPGFTPKNVKTLENKKDLNIKDAEVLAIHYSNDDWGKVDYADQTDALKDNSSKQIDKVGHTFVISLARAFGDSDSKRNIRLEKGAYKGKDVIRMDQFNVENVYLVPKKS